MEASFKCSFCGKSQDDVKRLVAGPDVAICDECVDLCVRILKEEMQEQQQEAAKISLPTPQKLFKLLSEYVVGQEQAKRVLSVAVYNHYKRLQSTKASGGVELAKSNVLIIGPTGSGKTLLAQTLARILDVPFAVADATTLTEAGYVGEDVENILLKILQAADFDLERARRGIIYIDEIDKIGRKSDNPSLTRDVSGEGVQQALLKIIEGTVASIPPQGGRKHPNQDYLQLDTSGILFICGGAFAGLEKLVQARSSGTSIGFDLDVEAVMGERRFAKSLEGLESEDLIKFGLIPEFVGRLPVVVTLDDLTREDLVHILTEPKNALIKQYVRLFSMEDVQLEFTKDAIESIARKSLDKKSGARGLRAILEALLLDTMFDLPDTKNIKDVVINSEVVEGRSSPLYIYSDGNGEEKRRVADAR